MDESREQAELLRRVRELELVARRNAAGFLSGNYVTSVRGKGMEFHEARKYVHGESIRMIDWNITARMTEPYVKIFHDERDREVFIALDVSPSMHTGWQERTKLEYAVETAATLAVCAAGQQDKIGFLTFSDRVHESARPAGGPRALFRALRGFLRAQYRPPTPTRESDPRAAIHAIQNIRGKRFVVFLISDFIDHDIPEDLKFMEKKHDLSLLHIYDPIEYAPDADVLLPAFSPEGGKGSAPIRPGQGGGLEEMRAFLRDQAGRYGMSTTSMSTRDPAHRVLTEFFHHKRKRNH